MHGGQVSLLTLSNGKCLDVDQAEQGRNGATVQIWNCHGGPNQQWRWERGMLMSAAGKCLGLSREQVGVRGSRVTVWDCHGGPNQQWRRNDRALVNSAGLCLSVSPGQTELDGGPVAVWNCTNSPNQQWASRPLMAGHMPPPPPPMQPMPPPPPPPAPAAYPMSPDRFGRMLGQVSGQAFIDEKIHRIQDYLAPDVFFTTAQLVRLMQTTAFGSERIRIAVMIWPRVLDQENFPELVGQLTFDSERQELRRQLRR